MYKKSVHIFLIIWLVVATTGYTVSQHYCGGDFVDLSVNAEAEPCCGDGGCCHIETEFYQLDEQVTGPTVPENINIKFSHDLFYPEFDFIITEINFPTNEVVNYAEPPPTADLSTQLSLFQSFLC